MFYFPSSFKFYWYLNDCNICILRRVTGDNRVSQAREESWWVVVVFLYQSFPFKNHFHSCCCFKKVLHYITCTPQALPWLRFVLMAVCGLFQNFGQMRRDFWFEWSLMPFAMVNQTISIKFYFIYLQGSCRRTWRRRCTRTSSTKFKFALIKRSLLE